VSSPYCVDALTHSGPARNQALPVPVPRYVTIAASRRNREGARSRLLGPRPQTSAQAGPQHSAAVHTGIRRHGAPSCICSGPHRTRRGFCLAGRSEAVRCGLGIIAMRDALTRRFCARDQRGLRHVLSLLRRAWATDERAQRTLTTPSARDAWAQPRVRSAALCRGAVGHPLALCGASGLTVSLSVPRIRRHSAERTGKRCSCAAL
jgi:hypothetical protein